MKTTMLIAVSLCGGLVLAGCKKPEDPDTLQQDVSEARSEGAKDIVEAQREAVGDVTDARAAEAKTQIDAASGGTLEQRGEAMADAHANTVNEAAAANYKIREAEIESAYQIAKARCGAYGGDEKTACLDRADNEREAALNVAKGQREQLKMDAGKVSDGSMP